MILQLKVVSDLQKKLIFIKPLHVNYNLEVIGNLFRGEYREHKWKVLTDEIQTHQILYKHSNRKIEVPVTS